MKIIILDGQTFNSGDLNWDPIAKLGSLEVFAGTKGHEILERAGRAEVILTNKVYIGRDILDILTRLRYIGVLATGYNNVDVDYARQLGLPVTNIPGYSGNSVAQTVFAYILHHANRVGEYNDSVKNGDWERCENFSYLLTVPIELAGKTLGILGYGDIGSRVAKIGRALGMKILVAEKPDGSIPARAEQDSSVEVLSLEELFGRSDYVSLHPPLTESTRALIGAKLLSGCKPGQILINTARGAIIDEEAVLNALDSSQLSYYIADVHDPEPPRASALIHHPKTFFTPHVAWMSREARSRAIEIAAANIEAWMKGDAINVVNRN